MEFQKPISNVPMVLGIIGGIIGLPAAVCSGACAVGLSSFSHSGNSESHSAGNVFLFIGIISALLGFVAAFMYKNNPKTWGVIMLSAGGLSLLSLITFNILALIVAILFIIGGIIAIKQEANKILNPSNSFSYMNKEDKNSLVLPSQQTVVKNETVIESSEQSEKEFKKDEVVLEPVIPVKEEKSEEFLTSQALNTDSEIPNFLLAKKKKRLLISGLFLALAIIGVAVWYFSHSENVNDNPVVQTVPINQSVQPENYTNTTHEYHPNVVENTSKPESQESDNSKLKINVETNLSQADNEIISSLIHRHTFDFDIAVNPTEYENMMGDYEDVVAKYYSKINVSKTIIEEDNKKYFAEVIRKARWILNTEKSKITKNQNGYFDVDLYGEYSFYYSYNSKKHDPEIEKQLQLHNHFILNNEYKIIEQYEMERQ